MSKFSEKKPKQAPLFKILVTAVIAVLTIYFTCKLLPWVLQLRDPVFRQTFRAKIDSFGIWGVVLMFFIQVLQIVLAVIPGEPVEVAAGVLYGGFGGFLLCEGGILVGQTIVFLLVRKFGRPLVELLFEKQKIDELKFLHDPRKLDAATFLLHLIPGTPKDILCYFAGLTPISLPRFLLLSSIARIPSVITSTFAGDAIGNGKLIQSIFLFIIVGVLGLAGILLHKPVVEHFSKHHKNK